MPAIAAAPPKGGAWVQTRAEVVYGRREVLAAAARLRGIAEGSGQLGELADLAYFFDAPTRVRYTPTLVLVYGPELVAGVLVYDTWFGWGRGTCFVSLNRRGLRTVFAPVERRLEAAALAAQTLLERGARFVNIDVDQGPCGQDEAAAARALAGARASARLWLPGLRGARAEWALHRGVKRHDLPLLADFESTLKAFGRRTRKNMKIYPRVCRTELGARFVAEADVSREEFLAMNDEVSFKVARRTAEWRYGSLRRFPELFLCGLRAGDGSWLSLVCGWRRGGEVTVLWQMNRRGYERYSLSTAMRSLLIEEEIGRGMVSLSIEGGTPHQMADGFRMREVYNLAVRRRSVMLWVLERVLARVGKGMPLAKALNKPWRRWNACGRLLD